MIATRTGIYTYDSGQQRFQASYPSNPGRNAWSVMEVTVNTTTPTYFGRVFNVNSFNLTTTATAAHRPRDLALVLDFSGSMKFGCETAFNLNNSNDLVGSLNGDPAYPKFGHYYAMSQRALATSLTGPTSNGSSYNPMRRTILFQDPGGETHASNNITIDSNGGPPVIQDFLSDSTGTRLNAFHNPQSAGSYNPALTPTAMPAPDHFADQSDSPVTYVGDKSPRKNRAAAGNDWAATVQEYFNGTNTTLSNTHALNANAPNWEGNVESNGYGANFKGYSMGPGYYGKTFFLWPPDPRWGAPTGQTITQAPDSSQINSSDVKKDVNGHYICDWRKRFFCYPLSSTNGAPDYNRPMDDNSRLFNSNGDLQQPAWNNSGTTNYRYAVNYKAILAWIKNGPQVLPPSLCAGRVRYYTAIPDDIPFSGGLTLDQVFWKRYIDTVLGIRTSNLARRSLHGRETTGWGTVRITAKSSLLSGGNQDANPNPAPYMHYNDNPRRPRAHLWFGPLTMCMFLTTDNDGSPNMWPGTCHESQCWQLKAGINSALDDIRINHPNDWACLLYFSNESGYATPRVTLSRDYTTMKNALFFPFSLLGTLDNDSSELRPYNGSFGYTGGGNIPNARGGTCPEMAFKVAYNQFSSAAGFSGRRGAAKVVIFETDGVPNHHCGGSFQNNGPYQSLYTGSIGTTYSDGNNDPRATDPAVAAVAQICAPDSASSPGYSTNRTPARVHAIAFGDLFETNQTQQQNALAFLLRVQKAGYTSQASDTAIESYKIITGDYTTRIDSLRQALERIMQSGVQISLIQ
jgi:hypothetical protein